MREILAGCLIGAVALIALAVAAILIARQLFPLPSLEKRPIECAKAADVATKLGRRMLESMARHPGKSGQIPILSGYDALGSRLELAYEAEQSIDAQYYIWHDDLAGQLLLKALQDAALRGVRVRLLLDDNGIHGFDQTLSALDGITNFEVRLFNPSTVRNPKYLGYAFDFMRMNRRMHNKAFIVDGAAAIIGGRNIGNEYFQVGDADFYLDLDVLAIGPIVTETAAAFDAYWNSASVFGISQIVKGRGDLQQVTQRLEDVAASDEARQLVGNVVTSAAELARRSATPEWTEIRLVVDDPIKGQGGARRHQLMITRLDEIMGDVATKMDLISAYFVPGKAGAKLLSDLAKTRRVRVLTNALNTTDVLLVHAGYTKYRRKLLEARVELYELKLRAGKTSGEDEIPRFGLSGASLHAKTFAIDDRRVFIGSFNFDPRSALLNCEMGFLIESPSLAKLTSSAFDGPIEMMSYKPALSAEKNLVWTERRSDGSMLIYQQEPGATWFQQVAIVIIGLLPIEWLL
ncbi:phospholipase D family protein [Paracoccus sp. (in: a-proteobacteria)]|uniref:phospholipase D family protein n=1 Tax=Paracoccus sp. TaxID=267 RepID=UPI0028986660|nr:phospholipase D family protein [Paracoccus sp. (in: a-proteobacteria)]